MSFNELSRRELQAKCKEYGLPANKSNVAMASSLTAFLGDPRTNVLARAPQVLAPVVAKNSNRHKVVPKIEMQETSLAALILAARPRDLVTEAKLVKKGRDGPEERQLGANLSPFMDTVPVKIEDDCMLPKTTPLLRRRRNPNAVPPPDADGVVLSQQFAQDCQTKSCCRTYAQPALISLFRISANVDRIISRATANLEKFQKWKVDLPQRSGADVAVGQ